MAEDLWRDVADTYDRSFATLCAGSEAAVLELVGEPASVLDVGCGSGHLAAALADAGHEVLAVDPDPAMVHLTRTRAGISATTGALPDLPVAEGSVDAVVANFVLNHVDHPRAAAGGLARVVRPGGRVVATIWPGWPAPPGVLWGEVLDAAGAVRPDAPRLAPHLDFERSPDGLATLLEEAGLRTVEARMHAWDWSVAPEDFWAGATSIGNFGVTWRAQTEEVRGLMRTAYDDALAPWLVDGLLRWPVECVLVEAVRPTV